MLPAVTAPEALMVVAPVTAPLFTEKDPSVSVVPVIVVPVIAPALVIALVPILMAPVMVPPANANFSASTSARAA